MTTTLTRLGTSQIKVLEALKANPTGLTAPSVRDEAGLNKGDQGTRQAHAVLGRLTDLDYVVKEKMSPKVAANNAHSGSKRLSAYRFKITSNGKKALKSAT